MKFVIVGAGAFGREVAMWSADKDINLLGFLDDMRTANMLGYPPILGGVEAFHLQPSGCQVTVSVANPKAREAIVGRLMLLKARFATLKLSCRTARTARVGGGSIMCPNSAVSADAYVGEHVHMNLCATVGHDAQIGDFCTLSSHVDIMGRAIVGRRVFFGSGARVLPDVQIGDDAVIGAGAVVMRDVPPGVTVYAQPARAL